MGQPRHQKLKDLASLAASTARVAAAEYGDLASSLERMTQDDVLASRFEDDSVIGDIGAAFQVLAGHVEQIRTLKSHLDRLSGRD